MSGVSAKCKSKTKKSNSGNVCVCVSERWGADDTCEHVGDRDKKASPHPPDTHHSRFAHLIAGVTFLPEAMGHG